MSEEEIKEYFSDESCNFEVNFDEDGNPKFKKKEVKE